MSLVSVSQNVKTGVITVVQVFKNAPSYEAGLLRGDIIYAINDSKTLVVSCCKKGIFPSFATITLTPTTMQIAATIKVPNIPPAIPTKSPLLYTRSISVI